MRLALDGGEDYELLCAGPEEAVLHAAALIKESTGEKLTMVGRLDVRREDNPLVSLAGADDEPVHLKATSWDHFRNE